MNLINQMRQSQKLNRKLHQEIRVQSVFDVTIYTIRNCVHSQTKNFFFFVAKIRNTHRKFAEKKPIHRYPSNILLMKFQKLSWSRIPRMVSFQYIGTYFKCHTTNYHIYYHCRSHFTKRDRHWSIDQFPESGNISKGEL